MLALKYLIAASRGSWLAICPGCGIAQLSSYRRNPVPIRVSHDRHHSSSSMPREDLWPTCANPTPYDILATRPGERYDKARFFELVKIYHPDRQHTSDGIMIPELPSLATRLERYRLAVLAHSILSDPQRRRQYDATGAGWATRPPIAKVTTAAGQNDKGTPWYRQPGSAYYNVTWEDWERWRERNPHMYRRHQYRRHPWHRAGDETQREWWEDEPWQNSQDQSAGENKTHGKKQSETIFMSNGLFSFCIVGATLGAAAMQISYAMSNADRMRKLRERQTAELTHDVKTLIIDDHLSSGEARIKAFMKRKEGSFYRPPPTLNKNQC